MVGLASDIEAGAASDRIHAGIAKTFKPAALVDLDDRHAIAKEPAQHRVGAVFGGGDPTRTGFFQLRLRPRHHLLIACLAADRIGPTDEIPGRDDIIEKDRDDEDDPGNDRSLGPANRRLDYP